MDRGPQALQLRIDHLVRRCHQRGMNVTPQRLAVYRALLEAEDHPSPELLFQRVRKRLPSISLATIYKSLDALEALGAVDQVPAVGHARRYEANEEQHHHVVCTRCQRVTDFYDEGFDRLRIAAKPPGFVVQTVAVQIRGLCARCARKRA